MQKPCNLKYKAIRETEILMNAFDWTKELTGKLQAAFGNRVAFVGLQGSRARGEAHEGSDIDVVVLFDAVTADDLAKYRELVDSMPRSELACGFVGSVAVLAEWPRNELFQFYNDTVPVLGELPETAPFTTDDAMEAARIGASGIYHSACHAIVFDGEAAIDILESLFKSAFFTLQALHYARTGEYPHTKSELAMFLEGDEACILEINCNWDKHHPSNEAEMRELVDLILGWAKDVICSA